MRVCRGSEWTLVLWYDVDVERSLISVLFLIDSLQYTLKMNAAAYLYTVAVADIESQRKGLVAVVWPAGNGASGLKISMPDPREHIGK